MKKDIIITSIYIATLLAMFLLFWKKSNVNNGEVTTVTKDSVIVYMVDTNKHSFDKQNVTINNSHYHYDNSPVDTSFIIRDFFTKKFAKDSVMDSLLKIVISDTLYKGEITHRNLTYKLIKPYQVIKTITEKSETIKYNKGFYLGGYFTATKTNASIGAALDFATPNQIYGLGIDPLQKSITGRVTFKLGKRVKTK